MSHHFGCFSTLLALVIKPTLTTVLCGEREREREIENELQEAR
jgi:hypothetical protein